MSVSGLVIPTECIGSIPRSKEVINAWADFNSHKISSSQLDEILNRAVKETMARLEEIGSQVMVDGEQSKPSFVSYPIFESKLIADGGAVIPFADGHTRQLPKLVGHPFKYSRYADSYIKAARQNTTLQYKQAIISPSAMSLLYPAETIPGYSRDDFQMDVIEQCAEDIKRCLAAGADVIQIDCTELRLSVKLDPSLNLLNSFVELINSTISGLPKSFIPKIGIHCCPGGDHDSTHSLDVDYAIFLPILFKINAGRFYLELAAENDKRRVLSIVRDHLPQGSMVFFGVTDPTDPVVETPEVVMERVLEIANFLPPGSFGTCDDCGFSPFSDDTSTSRETAFAKIKSRVEGTKMAINCLGL